MSTGEALLWRSLVSRSWLELPAEPMPTVAALNRPLCVLVSQLAPAWQVAADHVP